MVTTVTRWSLFDPGLGTTYSFSVNPNQMSSPFPQKALQGMDQNLEAFNVSGTITGHLNYLFREAQPAPVQFQFQGRIYDQAGYNDLLTWSQKKNRLQLTDHLGRTWSVQNVSFSVTPGRNPRRPYRMTYTTKMLIIGSTTETVGLSLPVSGLIQYLNFDGITGSNGTALASTVPDATGNGYAMAAIGGHAPTIKTNFLNGHTALQFSGSHGIIGARSVADDFTIFQVFKSSGYGGSDSHPYYGDAYCLYTAEFPGQADDFGTAIGTHDFVAGQGQGPDVSAQLTSGPHMDLSTWHVAVMERTKGAPTVIRTFRDTIGTTPLATHTESTGYAHSLNASANAAIGCVPAASEGFYTGYYACLLVYNRVLTDTERATVVGWLKNRYGI